MGSVYKRISELISKWPIDTNKAGRDFGEYLRNYITRVHNEGKFNGNEQYWDRQFLALTRLLNNEHKTKYPRTLTSSATGLTAEECNTILTPEVLELIKQENKSVTRKLFDFIKKKK